MKAIVQLLQESVELLQSKHESAVLNGRVLLSHYAAAKLPADLKEVEAKLHNEQHKAYHTSKAINKIKKQIVRLEKLS